MAYLINENTIVLNAEFYTKKLDSDGVKELSRTYIDPTDMLVQIFDQWGNQIGVDLPITTSNKIGVGKYQLNYELPAKYLQIAHEWSGMYNGYKVTGRKKVDIQWAEPATE